MSTSTSGHARDTIDETVSRSSQDKRERVDLGLALLSLVARPDHQLSRYDIAAWCGCTDAAIYLIEMRAMKKLRHRLRFGAAAAIGRELS